MESFLTTLFLRRNIPNSIDIDRLYPSLIVNLHGFSADLDLKEGTALFDDRNDICHNDLRR